MAAALYDPNSFTMKNFNSMALEADESWLILGIRAFTGGSLEPLPGSIEPIAVGQSVFFVNQLDGNSIITFDAGDDGAWKAILGSFTEPVLLELLTTFLGGSQYFRQSYQPIHMMPHVMMYQLMVPTRSMIDDWQNVRMLARWRLTNLGNAPVSGFMQLLAKKKRGRIQWL